MRDEHNYRVNICNEEKLLSDKELLYMLSSGTTKGIILYTLVVASLQQGFDLIIDEAEAHFHKTLVENMLSLYMDKTVNRHGATLLFSTHYCEVLDLFNRQDNIWVCQSSDKISIKNMYESFEVRYGLLKSKRFYNNAFQTAVNYDELMNLKRKLMK
jgi:AAA15 family ATPase/GTPase